MNLIVAAKNSEDVFILLLAIIKIPGCVVGFVSYVVKFVVIHDLFLDLWFLIDGASSSCLHNFFAT